MAKAEAGVCLLIADGTGASIRHSLDALGKQSRQPDEIIVVGPPELQKQLAGIDGLRVVGAGKASPRAQLLNIGLRAVRTEQVVVLEAGAEPQGSDWIETLTAPLSEEGVAATCGQFTVQRLAAPEVLLALPELANRPLRRRARRESPYETEYVTGRCDAFSMAALRAVSFLDVDAFPWIGWHYDLSARLKEQDAKILQTGADTVIPAASSLSPGLWRSAVQTGRSSLKLQQAHRILTDNSPLFLLGLVIVLATVVSGFSIAYATVIASVAFIVSWLQYVKFPGTTFHMPAALFHLAFYVTAVMAVRHGGVFEPLVQNRWQFVHPAILRQHLFIFTGLGFYLLVALLSALWLSVKASRARLPVWRAAGLGLAALAWYPLTGAGYLRGWLKGND